MSSCAKLLPVLITVLALVCPVSAAENDTEVKVRALVESAIEMFKSKGTEAALKAINDRNGPFVKGDLYVFALTMDNTLVGQPHEHTLRNMNLNNIKDNNGLLLFQKFSEVVSGKGEGWVEYLWAKPGAKVASRKTSFVKKVPNEGLYVGAGYYLD